MISVKLAKKAPANASIVGELVAVEQLGGRGLDKRQLGRLGFKAEAGQVTSLAGKGETVRVLVGIGKESALDHHELRRAAAAFAKSVADQRSAVLTVGSRLGGVDRATAVQALTEGLAYGGYRFDEYKSKPGTHLGSVTLVGDGDASEADGLARGKAIAGAVCWARDLLNEPGGTLTAPEFADRVAARGAEAGVEVKVLGKRQIEAERMGGLLAVNQGSVQEPRFVTMTYAPEGATASIAFVGKGITFDSGGLSIKPADAMMTMKNDMGGAAAVVAAVCAIAELGLPIKVTGYTPMTDNMTGGDAQRPGDIFTARNGKTVEVLNTDAEGRLILADALVVASESKPDAIVDLATLTGACIVALGDKIAGLMSTSDDLADELRGAADSAGERVWHLPLPDDYRKQLDSPVADMKNIGSRAAGTLTAGLFLKEFVDGSAWAHLDIAGPAFTEDGSDAETPRGGTGFGVRTLVAFAEGRAGA